MIATKHVMVRYRVKPERIEENRQLVRAVYAELDRVRPDGLRYATLEESDGGFVHVAEISTPDGANPLQQIAAFKAFAAHIKERCSEAPATTELARVGSYRLLAE
jgi:hypothetical protein